MAKIPGTTNGGVPPNIPWDPLDPPYINGCNNMVQIHAPECDGSCEKTACTELDVEIINEQRNWNRLGMSTDNIQSDTFRLSIQVQTLMTLMEGLCGADVVKELYQRTRVDEMTNLRLSIQEQVQRARFGLTPKPGILGPDGNPL